MNTKVSHFRTWKSGKTWLFAAAAIAAFAVGGVLSTNASAAVVNNNAGGVPVYEVAKGNDHYLTTDKTYADQLVAKSGYNSEKVVAYTPAQSGTVVHNWYNTKTGHFYTTNNSSAERARLTKLGYAEFYTSNIYSAAADDNNAIPVNGSFNKKANHFYSTSLTEPAGYGNQTVAFYGLQGKAALNPIATTANVTLGSSSDTIVKKVISLSGYGSTDASGSAITKASQVTVTGYDATKVGVQKVTISVPGATNAEATVEATVTVAAPTVAASPALGTGFTSSVIDTTQPVSLGKNATLNVVNGSTVDPYIGLTEPAGFENVKNNTPSAALSLLNDTDSTLPDVLTKNVLSVDQMKELVTYTVDDQDAKTTGVANGKIDTTKTGDVYTIHYYVTNVDGTTTQLATAKITVSAVSTSAPVTTPDFAIDTTKIASPARATTNIATLTLGQTVLGATSFDPASYTNATAAKATEVIAFVPAAEASAPVTDAWHTANKQTIKAGSYDPLTNTVVTADTTEYYQVVKAVDTTKTGNYSAGFYTTTTTSTSGAFDDNGIWIPGTTTTSTVADGQLSFTVANATNAVASLTTTAAEAANGSLTIGENTVPVVIASATAANLVAYAPSSYTAADSSTLAVSNNSGTLTATASTAQSAQNPFAATSETVTTSIVGTYTKVGSSTHVTYSSVQIVAYTYAGYTAYVAFAAK